MMQAQDAGAGRRAPAVMTTVGAELARLVRLLTALVLLGAALLVVALVGQGVAGARELPLDGTSRPHALLSPVAPATPAGASFVRQWAAGQDLLGEPTAALQATARSDIPPEERSTTPPPEWWLALRTEPPAPRDRPAERGNGDDQESLDGAALTAGPAAAARATGLAAQAAAGAGPAGGDGRAAGLQRRAAEIKTTIGELKQQLHELRATSLDYPEALDGLFARLEGLAAEHREIRRTVPYPPEFDALKPSQLKLEAERVRGGLWANSLASNGWLRGLRLPKEDRARMRDDLELERDALLGEYSDVTGAVWARLQNVKDERDQLSQPGTSPEGRQRRARLADLEATLQDIYNRIRRDGAYPPYLDLSSLEEVRGRAAFLRDAIEANQRRLAQFEGLLADENSPLRSPIEKEIREYQKELVELNSYLRRYQPARPAPKPPPPAPPPRRRMIAEAEAEAEAPEPSVAPGVPAAAGEDADGSTQAWTPAPEPGPAELGRSEQVTAAVAAVPAEEPAADLLQPGAAGEVAFDAGSPDLG